MMLFRTAVCAVVLALGIQISGAQEATAKASLKMPPIDHESRELKDLVKIVDSDAEGGFLNPRFSPDGLQLILTRPGYQGVYAVPVTGGKPQLVADENAYDFTWTPSGKIQLGNRAGGKVYNLDGTEGKAEKPLAPEAEVFCQNDKVFVLPAGADKPLAITDDSDRFIQPHLCPAHKMVAFIGIESGLYLSRASGQGEPIYLGPGVNFSWAPDSSFLIFNHLKDDGHSVVESDIYQYQLRAKKLFNLTSSTDLMVNGPHLSPDGKKVAFEVEGAIYVGTIESTVEP